MPETFSRWGTPDATRNEAVAAGLAPTVRALTVLTAWPMSDELRKPELGYVAAPMSVVAIDNFSLQPMQRAAAKEDGFDTALIFSTKYDPPRLRSHARMHRHRYRGQVWYLLQDAISSRVHRFAPAAQIFLNPQ